MLLWQLFASLKYIVDRAVVFTYLVYFSVRRINSGRYRGAQTVRFACSPSLGLNSEYTIRTEANSAEDHWIGVGHTEHNTDIDDLKSLQSPVQAYRISLHRKNVSTCQRCCSILASILIKAKCVSVCESVSVGSVKRESCLSELVESGPLK